jgi:hypothetical protein
MGIPKRKNNIEVYGNKETERGVNVINRRQELLDRITKSDSFLPDSLLHEDMDSGMLDYVKSSFKIVSDGGQIPVIPRILTVQRWSEFSNNWEFSDEDGNMKLPFIAIIRKPDVQPGTNPVTQRTIPDRQSFHYATVPTWNGTQMGADVYKIPQPVAVDVSYEVVFVCNKLRELNKFNKIVLQKFSSRQSYTSIKGHYIPIVLDGIEDNTPMETLDGRRFYLQTYKFTMLGLLIDSEEFEVKPAISRAFLVTEFITDKPVSKKTITGNVDITVCKITADGTTTSYSVGEPMTKLFNVYLNGELLTRDLNYLHISGTSRLTFLGAPENGDIITIHYYRGKKDTQVDNVNTFLNNYGKVVYLTTESITFTAESTVYLQLSYDIDSFISLDINGLLQEENSNFVIQNTKQIKLLGTPSIGSVIDITYLH